MVAAVLNNSDPSLGIRSVLSIAPVDFHGLILSGVPLLMLLPAGDGDVADNAGAMIYDRAAPGGAEGWFKSQMYVYGTIHNFFNREWKDEWEDDGITVPDLLPRPGHEAMLRAWSRTFFELTLKNAEAWRPVMAGDSVLEGLQNQRVFPSYRRAGARIADHFEDAPDDAAKNSLAGKVQPTGFFTFDEFEFRQTGGDVYNGTFFHDTDGLVAVWREQSARFTSEIPAAHADNSAFDYFAIRVTQVMDKLNEPPDVMSFGIGLEDLNGVHIDVASTEVGVIPFPYEHPWGRKSMMRTLRVPLACFDDKDAQPVSRDKLRMLHFPFNSASPGVVGLDQLELTH